MGEYAEMMLDGTCCQQCGEYLGSDNGFPTSCPSCAGEEWDFDPHREAYRPKGIRKHPCPQCGRMLRSANGVRQHIADKHPKTSDA
jgi:hypothetical protein